MRKPVIFEYFVASNYDKRCSRIGKYRNIETIFFYRRSLLGSHIGPDRVASGSYRYSIGSKTDTGCIGVWQII
jgi:hypothetical protein